MWQCKKLRRKSVVDRAQELIEAAGLGGVSGTFTEDVDHPRSRHRDDRYSIYSCSRSRERRGPERRNNRLRSQPRRHADYRWDEDGRYVRSYYSRSRSCSRSERKSEKGEQAAKAAIVAGAIEGFRRRKIPSTWTGLKGK